MKQDKGNMLWNKFNLRAIMDAYALRAKYEAINCGFGEESVMIRICCAVYEELHCMTINPDSINKDESPRRQYEPRAAVHQFHSDTLTCPHKEM